MHFHAPRLIALRGGDRNEETPKTENKIGMLMRRACAHTLSPRSFSLLEQNFQPTPSPLCGLASWPLHGAFSMYPGGYFYFTAAPPTLAALQLNAAAQSQSRHCAPPDFHVEVLIDPHTGRARRRPALRQKSRGRWLDSATSRGERIFISKPCYAETPGSKLEGLIETGTTAK